MSWFSGIVGALFGGGNTQEKAVDFAIDTAKGVGAWIDEQQFTDQERAEAHANNMNTLLKGIEATRDENSTRSVTRRYLAWGIMGVYLGAFIVTITIGYEAVEYRKFLLEAVQIYGIDKLAWAVGGFYFFASITRSLRK